jgi:hypothetical protein
MAISSNFYWQEQAHRAPCSCLDCLDCTEWHDRPGDSTYNLDVRSEGECLSRSLGNIVVVLPDPGTLTAGWCIAVRNPGYEEPLSGDFYIRDFADPAVQHFSVEGVTGLYHYVTINFGGEACICWDGVRFVVTGAATGWNYT